MGLAADREDKRPSSRDLEAEATSPARREPTIEDFWGRGEARQAVRDLSPVESDRWPLIATIIAIILGASALIAMRERIVRIFPPMATAYRLLGAPVNLAGLELRDVRARVVTEGGRKVLVTEGEIVNLRREPNRTPPISLAVRGDNGLARYVWTTSAPKARLDPAETIRFSARLASPPEDGTEVLVRFAGAGTR